LLAATLKYGSKHTKTDDFDAKISKNLLGEIPNASRPTLIVVFGYLTSYFFLTIRTLLRNLLFAHIPQTEDLSDPCRQSAAPLTTSNQIQ